MASNAYQRQIKNRNFLSPTGFKLVVNRSPKVAFFSNAANLPGITLGEAVQPTYLKDIPTPGDKIVFDDFNIRFLFGLDISTNINEASRRYYEIQDKMKEWEEQGLPITEYLNEDRYGCSYNVEGPEDLIKEFQTFDNGIFDLTQKWFERYDGDGDNPKVAASVS